MTPDEIAGLFPVLHHMTLPSAVPSIRRHGLLPASALLDLFAIDGEERHAIESAPRRARVTIRHERHGEATITDNLPLSEAALERCLDDGLTPRRWLRMLNARVFFWPDERTLGTLLNARANRGRRLAVLRFDTRSLARAHGARMAFSPINSGATIRRPARRGLSTFQPIAHLSYDAWRRLRGRLDTVREISVEGGVPDAHAHLIGVTEVQA